MDSDRLNEHNAVCTAVIDMNGSSDYVEAYARVNVQHEQAQLVAESDHLQVVWSIQNYRIG